MTQKPDNAICWCPACDEGWVKAVVIQPIAISGRLCGECEAFWHNHQMIVEEVFTQLSVLAKEYDMKIGDISIEMRDAIV